jgi:hypothetical protein
LLLLHSTQQSISFILPVAADAASCVSFSSLKHMLNSQDALLGPWLPGRDMLEDELRTFVGECGFSLHLIGLFTGLCVHVRMACACCRGATCVLFDCR